MLSSIINSILGSSPPPSSEEELARTGVLTSLNFPKDYSSNINQVQKVQVPEGNTIRIRFTDFKCEREFDTVRITDKDGTRLGFFDGGVNSDDDWRKEIVSNTDTVEVLFHTDSSVVHKGWRLDWSTKYKVSIRDGSLPTSGVLTSPNYPSLYPNAYDNTDTIEVAEGKTIQFQWTNINTEPTYDYIQAVDGDGTQITQKISGRYDNEDMIESVTYESNSNIVHIKFHTDNHDQMTGWRLEWSKYKVSIRAD